MRELLETLCCRNGAPGDEDEVRDFIRDYAAPYATSIRTDPLGNLIVFKKGKCATGHSFLIAAHMDEVAVIVTDVTDEGYLKFRFLGGVDRRVALGKRVFLGSDRVPGITLALPASSRPSSWLILGPMVTLQRSRSPLAMAC